MKKKLFQKKTDLIEGEFMKKIFVTGATGFIGTNVLNVLKEEEYDIYILTRKTILRSDKVKLVQGDISDKDFIENVLASIKPEYLLHFAWDVQDGDYADANKNHLWIKWSQDLVRAFLENGGKNVIATGTCFEYDLNVAGVLKKTSVCAPKSLYGKCKLETYNKLFALCKEYRARFVWMRLFYPYGPGEESRKLITTVIRVLKNDNHFLCKTPFNKVDYIHVKDIAEIVLRLIRDDKIHGIVNVGSGKGYYIKDIIKMIAKQLNKEEHIQIEASEKYHTIVSEKDLLEKLSYTMKYSLEEGIAEMINCIK